MAIPSCGDTKTEQRVTIVGAGSIGIGLAVVYGIAGHSVSVFDVQKEQRQGVRKQVEAVLVELLEFGLIQSDPDEFVANIQVAETLGEAVVSADFVHECAPENLDLKRELMRELDEIAPRSAVIASASSAITASEFAAGLPGRSRYLVAHPGNPPFLLRVIEIVPAPFTAEDTIRGAEYFLASSQLMPVRVRRELSGFIFNRLQGALLREAYCLVRDGVASVEDIDCIVRDGLGLRWSVVGPFETVDLNTRGGIGRHAKILGPAYAAMGAERGQHDPWTTDLVTEVESQRRVLMPLDQWEDRVHWRNRKLMALMAGRLAGRD